MGFGGEDFKKVTRMGMGVISARAPLLLLCIGERFTLKMVLETKERIGNYVLEWTRSRG